MDCQPALVGESQQSAILECEQAVFTSTPSPMGRGYRLVSASSGVTPDEKREIVQRAPSHGNLCDAGPDAAGLACFSLTGGRWCVMSSWHCELEHTGRGGHRVHTHALFLTPAEFARISYDALALVTALRAISDGAIPANNLPLRRLELDLSANDVNISPDWSRLEDSIGERALQVAAQIADAVISGRRVLVANAPDARRLLWLVGAFAPAAVRSKLSFSAGLKFSPARDFDLVLATLRRDEVERVVDEHQYTVIEWNASGVAPTGPHACWFEFVTDACRAGNAQAMARGVASINGPDWNDALCQICQLDADIRQIATADMPRLEAISATHRPFVRRNELQVNLHLKLLSATVQRRTELLAARAAQTAMAEEAAQVEPTRVQ